MAKGRYEEWLTDDGLLLLEGWARNGLTEEQIAHNVGISSKTLREWKNKYSTIGTALKKGKEVVDLMVENALFKSAMGYDYEETIQEINGDKKIVKKFKKHMPPNTTAQIFWLKNRRPELWREKQAQKVEKYEDDGLKAALEESVSEEMQDDSYMIPPEEENSND